MLQTSNLSTDDIVAQAKINLGKYIAITTPLKEIATPVMGWHPPSTSPIRPPGRLFLLPMMARLITTSSVCRAM